MRCRNCKTEFESTPLGAVYANQYCSEKCMLEITGAEKVKGDVVGKVRHMASIIYDDLGKANEDELMGRIMRLGKSIEKDEKPEDMLELALVIYLGVKMGEI